MAQLGNVWAAANLKSFTGVGDCRYEYLYLYSRRHIYLYDDLFIYPY
jgi:hypothetical protein